MFASFKVSEARKEILELAEVFADSKLVSYTLGGVEPFIKLVEENIEEIEEIVIQEGCAINLPELERCFEIYLRSLT